MKGRPITLRLIVLTLTLTISAPLVISAQAPNNYLGRISTTVGSDRGLKQLIGWWDRVTECSAKKIIDSARYEGVQTLVLQGQFPVQYYMYGSTSSGGVVQFRLKFQITNGSCEYEFFSLEHKSTPGVRHKDGGPILSNKPVKGSLILSKTWKGYQDQTMEFIHTAESEFSRALKSK